MPRDKEDAIAMSVKDVKVVNHGTKVGFNEQS
jgi:hypothetical protein